MKKINVSAPGRICLFGEHQDYLGLPVITAAINLRISITARPRPDRMIYLDLPDIGAVETIDLDKPVVYGGERDYYRSGINIVKREGIVLPFGFDARIHGTIPINSGTSSSSALVIAWIKLLLVCAGDRRAEEPLQIARLAHRAEVLEFNEPGGQMDHYASALGGALYIDFADHDNTRILPAQFGTFVLGDSREPKDTVGILKRVKHGTLDALSKHFSGRDIHGISFDDIKAEKSLTENEINVLKGNITNRALTQRALALLSRPPFDPAAFGRLLNAHHAQLRDRLCVSTPKIEKMVHAALESGALGAKINGSGGGGCMFAYAPENAENVAQAITAAGGRAFIVKVDKGVRVDFKI